MSIASVFSFAGPSMVLNGRNTNGNSNSKRKPSHKRIMVSPANLLFAYNKNLHRRMDYLISTGKLNMQACKDIHNAIRNVGIEQNVYLGSKLISMYALCGSVDDALQVFEEITERNVFVWTAMISGYARNGLYEEALRLYSVMKSQGIFPTHFTFSSVLNACAGVSALEVGMDIHTHIIKHGFLSNTVLGTALMHMYAKCERIEDARQVFDRMPEKNVVSWGAIISGLAQNGEVKESVKCFRRMVDEGVKPNSQILLSILLACTDLGVLRWGKEIHARVVKTHLESSGFFRSALIAMYIQCKELKAAHQLFDRVSEGNVSLWTTMIAAYVQNGRATEALDLFRQMNKTDVKPNPFTISSIFSAISELKSLEQGKEIHCYVIKANIDSNVFVQTALVSLYTRCKSFKSARRVFDIISERKVSLWNSMITSYCKNGFANEAFELYRQMNQNSVKPFPQTICLLLSICSDLAFLKQGKEIHCYVIRNHIESNEFLGSTLVAMYGHHNKLQTARKVFDRVSERDAVLWNAMIAVHFQNGFANEALELFRRMNQSIVKPCPHNISSLLPVYTDLSSLKQGKEIHCYVIKANIDSNVFVQTALVSLYTRCKSFKSARRVFDIISERKVSLWNSMITSYCKNGFANEAFELYRQMNQNSVKPFPQTICLLLSICSDLAFLKQGKEIHCYVIRNHIESNEFLGSTLVAMYGHHNKLQTARKVFDRVSERDAVLWNAMIAVHFQNGFANEALELFRRMNQSIVKPCPHNISSLLPGYTDLSSLKQGKEIHCYVIKANIDSNVFVQTALVSLYTRCKSFKSARRVFDIISERKVSLWNSMITSYCKNGFANEAFELYRQMNQNSVKPFPQTICLLLSICSDLAFLKQGKEIHCYVIRNHIESNEFLGSTLVAMYGHHNKLQTARKVFDRVSERDAVLWNAMIAVHFQNGFANEALELFRRMNQSIVKPCPHNISSLLPGYTDLSSLKQGKEIHCYVIRNNLETNEFVGSALVAMYGRLKRLEDARRVFDRIPERDVILWNAMITAYCQSGCATEALKLLGQVPQNAMKSYLVFISGISSCT